MLLAAVEFPPIKNIVEWPDFGAGFNKIGLICAIAFAVPTILFLVAGRRAEMVPRGVQGFAETTVEFIEEQVAKPGIGVGYEPYVPLLVSFFVFIAIGNLFEVIPFFQMPMNARMGPPLVFALVAWAMFIGVGVRHNGAQYFKDVLFPPGVPKALYFLVTPIEFLSTFLVRPFSHAVRLFANMLAGHILLVTFSVLCISLWSLGLVAVILPFTFMGLVVFTAFEIGVSFIQAFVFAILAAVYIGGALHPAH
ncbi:MAG: F0F1 ATP synthase subunit A [Acidimicrobiia bacterium]|nr:F0F1 ATP synthase subunit A [Acidimicrobiia bacterium]